MIPQNKAMTWGGWLVTALVALGLGFSAFMKFKNAPEVTEAMIKKFQYPESTLLPIGALEAGCLLIFLIPRTAVLGAILLTGYLGGAIATHVRVEDAFYGPLIAGILPWLALWLRDPRIRSLIPLN